MEEILTRAANNVLKATEEISVRMEEGLTALMTGSFPKISESTSQQSQDFDGEIEEDLMDSPLQGMAESVLNDILENQAKPEGAVEKFQAFRHAITWSEPFILSLVAFQIVMFFIVLMVSRRNSGITPRVIVMIFIAGVVRSAEKLNEIAGRRWESFATQNYFDRQGVFVAIMFCSPLLVDSLIMLVMFLSEAANLLVAVKTNELKKKRNGQKRVKTEKAKKNQ